MKVLGVDLESDGLQTDTCKILEVGACILDTDTKRIMTGICFHVKETVDDNSEAIKINGLTQNLLDSYGVENPTYSLKIIHHMIEKCDVVCAQNGNKFDKLILERYFKELGFGVPDKIWIDTKTDIVFPKHMKSNSLVPLAAYHGFLNPFPHNALFDVATMLTILSQYDIEKVIERAKSPMLKIRANVPRDMNPLLKSRSYRWDPDNKMWWKELKAMDLIDEKIAFPTSAIEVI